MKKGKRRTKRGSTNKPGRGPSDPTTATRPKLLAAFRISNKKRREMLKARAWAVSGKVLKVFTDQGLEIWHRAAEYTVTRWPEVPTRRGLGALHVRRVRGGGHGGGCLEAARRLWPATRQSCRPRSSMRCPSGSCGRWVPAADDPTGTQR